MDSGLKARVGALEHRLDVLDALVRDLLGRLYLRQPPSAALQAALVAISAPVEPGDAP